jgi:hypothetical protein
MHPNSLPQKMARSQDVWASKNILESILVKITTMKEGTKIDLLNSIVNKSMVDLNLSLVGRFVNFRPLVDMLRK